MSKKLRLLMILGDLLRLNFQKLVVDSEPEKADFLRRRKRQSERLAERQADKYKY
jgi:hypothetical protein